jgi:Spy/CpxP family protein refolding chaperone
MKRVYVVVTVLFLFFLAATLLVAAPDSGDGKPGSFGRTQSSMDAPHRFEGGPKLSKEQKDKARELEARYNVDTRDWRYELEQKKLEMRKLFTDPKTSEAALLAKEREIGALQQKMFESRAQMKIEWRRILTADQIRELDRMPMGPESGHRPGPHMGPAMGPHMGPATMRFDVRE